MGERIVKNCSIFDGADLTLKENSVIFTFSNAENTEGAFEHIESVLKEIDKTKGQTELGLKD